MVERIKRGKKCLAKKQSFFYCIFACDKFSREYSYYISGFCQWSMTDIASPQSLTMNSINRGEQATHWNSFSSIKNKGPSSSSFRTTPTVFLIQTFFLSTGLTRSLLKLQNPSSYVPSSKIKDGKPRIQLQPQPKTKPPSSQEGTDQDRDFQNSSFDGGWVHSQACRRWRVLELKPPNPS